MKLWIRVFFLTFCAYGLNVTPVLAASEVSLTRVQQLYVAYYGRPGDPGGVGYWANQLDSSNGNLEAITDRFGNSDEFTERFGALNNEQLVTNLFEQMFNRAPRSDSDGFLYWLDQLTQVRLATVATRIADGAQNEDKQTLANKVTIAIAITLAIVEEDKLFLSPDIPSIRAAISKVSIFTQMQGYDVGSAVSGLLNANPIGGGNDSIPGIKTIVKSPAIAPAPNEDSNPLINQISDQEKKYIAILTKDWDQNQETYIKEGSQESFLEDGMGKVQRQFKDNFHKIEGYQQMRSNEVWTSYWDFLNFKIEIYTNDMEAAGITGKWFDEYFNGSIIPGIQVIVRNLAISPAADEDGDLSIARINDLEKTYIEILAKDWDQNQEIYGGLVTRERFLEYGMGRVQRQFRANFFRIEGHQEMTAKSAWNAYGDFLNFKIEIYTNDMEAAGITGKWFDEY